MQNRIAVGLFFVFAGACTTVEPPAPPAAPRITAFSADKTELKFGESATLSFTTVDAAKVEVFDDEGNSIALTGEAAQGSATVTPSRSTFYVLRATGAGGRDVAYVQIAVDEPVREIFLVAVPSTVEAGGEAQLLWSASGATSATIAGSDGSTFPLTGSTGTVAVRPTSTTRYTLTASGAGAPLTALAVVTVTPVVLSAAFSAPLGVQPGQALTLTWATSGATRLTISERTFGLISEQTDAAAVAMGSFAYTVPTALPNGIPVTSGLPLRFTVTASSGQTSVSREVVAVTGDVPVIVDLVAPAAASQGRTFTLRWKTENATRIVLSVGGAPIFETLETELARVIDGSLTLPAPAAETLYTFSAFNQTGIATTRSFTVKPVSVPVISMFELPGTINTLGDAVNARWTTTNAVRLTLGIANGPVLATITAPGQIAMGTQMLYLGSSATVELTAFNAAGDIAVATRAFDFLPPVTIDPNPALPGDVITVSWAFADAGASEVIGLPGTPPVVTDMSTRFVDLGASPTATELVFSDKENGSRELPLAGFRFPFGGRVQSRLFASVEGVLTLTEQANLATNRALLDAGTTTILAAYWDDLRMGTDGRVLTEERTLASGERAFIVQWDSVELANNPTSELTFQVQLLETGELVYAYDTLTSPGASATVGVTIGDWGVRQQVVYNGDPANAPAEDQDVTFFGGSPANGSFTFPAANTTSISLFADFAGRKVAFSPTVRVFRAGELKVNEAMPAPASTLGPEGQWVELSNVTAQTLDLSGLTLVSPAFDAGYVFPANTFIDAGAYLVIGPSADTNLNGGAPVSLVTPDVPLDAKGSVALKLRAVTLSSLAWDAGTPGYSEITPERLLVASGQTLVCRPRTATFGMAGSIGTPGGRNESCGEYVVSAASPNYVTPPPGSELTLVSTGTFSALDEGVVSVVLPAPFTYFGQTFTKITVHSNGFIVFGDFAASAISNPTTPSTTTPNAVAAAFWDDLEGRADSSLAAFSQGDRFIISWTNWSVYLSTTTTNMTFQVHLLDSGAIEFHYAELTATTPTNQARVEGNSATVWLENVPGTLAIPWGVNEQILRSGTAVRYTPAP